MDINDLINNCRPYNHSWLWGLLRQRFGPCIKFWPDPAHPVVHSGPAVVFFDDEKISKHSTRASQSRSQVSTGFFDSLAGRLVITQNLRRCQQLSSQGIDSLYWPWTDWLFNLIPLRRIGVLPSRTHHDGRVFNFLNRGWHPGRKQLLGFLLDQEKDLAQVGYITAGEIPAFRDHPLVQQDSDFRDFYLTTDGVGYEQNSTIFRGIECSVNMQNFFYIAENVPGKISIQVESAWEQEEFFIDITEKSMIGFVTQQMPIVIGQRPGLIASLAAQGFDVFDDLLDHSYDTVGEYGQRLLDAVRLNRSVLSGRTVLPDILPRLVQNQIFLVNQWTDRILSDLIRAIENFLSKEKTSES